MKPDTFPAAISRCQRARGILSAVAFALALLGLLPAVNGFDGGLQKSSACRIEAGRWTAAENLFRSDSRWLGGDGAVSVDLGNQRVLWLFGDSFVNLSGTGERRTSDLVRNSMAIQTGYDPAGARMQFFWKTSARKPVAYFSPAGERWFWPASGIMVGRRLMIFLMKVETADNALGFEVCGWQAVMVDNPGETPDKWTLTYLKSPQRKDLVVGCGTPVLEAGYLQVFAVNVRNRAVYLVRWSEPRAAGGVLVGPQWWAGSEAGWIGPEPAEVMPRPIMLQGQFEFSVTYVPRLKRYFQIQTLSVLNPCLAVSTASVLTGPWSGHECFFSPPEQGPPDTLVYAGRSHPMLTGADLALTYVVNTTREDRLLSDRSIYFPIVLKGRIGAGCVAP